MYLVNRIFRLLYLIYLNSIFVILAIFLLSVTHTATFVYYVNEELKSKILLLTNVKYFKHLVLKLSVYIFFYHNKDIFLN